MAKKAIHQSNGYIAVPIKDENANLTYPVGLKKHKTVMAGLFLVLSMIANDAVLAWIHERVPETEPLPDLWFSIFPEVPAAIVPGEALMIICVGIALVSCALHAQRWVVVRRLSIIVGLCFFIRAICIALIQVPVPSKSTFCGAKEKDPTISLVVERVIGAVARLGMNLFKERNLCGDLIISGHTISFIHGWLFVREYGPKSLNCWLPKLLWFSCMLGIVCMLLARKHYTVDVLFAYFMATRLFWTYHSLLKEKNLMIGETWWRPLFNYFESDIDF